MSALCRLTRVACCDESTRHHDEKCVKWMTILKKIERPGEKRSGNDSNGFGKLIACSFQKNCEIIDIGSVLGSNDHFTRRCSENSSQLWNFLSKYNFFLYKNGEI